MNERKTYVLDTSVLVDAPYCLRAFDDNDLVIPDIVIEELDGLKTRPDETGRNARQAAREIEAVRLQGDIVAGVTLYNGGTVRVVFGYQNVMLGQQWDTKIPDNRILQIAKGLASKVNNSAVVLVSRDVNLRIKAAVAGIAAEDYRSNRVAETDSQYSGRAYLNCTDKEIDTFYSNEYLETNEELIQNQFVVMQNPENPQHSGCGWYDGTAILPLKELSTALTPFERQMNVYPKNVGQTFALHALLAPASVAPLVILKGPAGTAKTFLSLAAGLWRTVGTNEYNRVLLSRPNVKFDDDIGYLKGSETDKVMPLLRPCIDNLEQIVSAKCGLKKSIDAHKEISATVQSYLESDIISPQALAYLRGRSIHETWVLIDEAQNLTPTQALGIITRAGNGTKIVMVGDPSQIDTPKLDVRMNGLSYAAEKMKGSPLCWQITFDESECVRSPLAKEAAEHLTPKGARNSSVVL